MRKEDRQGVEDKAHRELLLARRVRDAENVDGRLGRVVLGQSHDGVWFGFEVVVERVFERVHDTNQFGCGKGRGDVVGVGGEVGFETVHAVVEGSLSLWCLHLITLETEKVFFSVEGGRGGRICVDHAQPPRMALA